MVVVFHSGLDWLPGGFLGVSIFFTLSGFLITSLLINECEESGSLDLKKFWGRRLRRLAPASLVTIAAVVGLASWLSTNIEAHRVKGDGISSILYFSNWRFVYSGHSYGELFAAPSPLQHLWSLAIEEQLYVVVPVIVAGLFAVGLRRRAIGGVMLALAAVSTIATVASADRDLIYYGTHTRAAELLIGAALACLGGPRIEALATRPRTRWSTVYVLPLLAVLALARWSNVRSDWVYSGALTGFAAVSALCLIGAIRSGPVQKVLAWSPLVVTGRTSYGMYLFHWPVFVWLDNDRIDLDGVALFGVQFVVTAVVTALSYWLVEQPIRRRTALKSPKVSLLVLAASIVGTIVLASSVLASPTAPVSHAPQVLSTVPSTPSMVAASNMATTTLADQSPKLIDRTGPLSILVIGDSTAVNIAEAMADAADGNLGVISGGVLGCPLSRAAVVRDREGSQQDVTYCPDNIEVVSRHRATIDAVVIIAGVANQWAYQRVGSDAWIEPGSNGYHDDLDRLLDHIQEIVAPRGLPILVFETPPVRDNPKVFGDDIESLVRWSEVILEWDSDWHSVKTVPYADALSDPNSDEGRIERPDGVHLSDEFGAELARVILIPRLRDKYFDAIDEMSRTGCLSAAEQELNLELCRIEP